MLYGIIITTILLGLIGCLIALLLNFAGDKFYVKVNENTEKVRELLPGNNCGGCGYAGCDSLAEAIAEGKASPNSCPVTSNKAEIAALVGSSDVESIKKVAFVHCVGDCEKTTKVGEYSGARDCLSAKSVQGNGGKACLNGCLGFGTCVSVCKFDALHIINGIAVVDKEACVGCGACTRVCPNNLIELIPYDATYKVACSSQDKGAIVKKACTVGCLGCTLCVKQCPNEAISMQGNVPRIDHEKCNSCGACAEKCPVKIIK